MPGCHTKFDLGLHLVYVTPMLSKSPHTEHAVLLLQCKVQACNRSQSSTEGKF